MTFRDLPAVVRRSFEAFLQRFQDDHPGSILRRTSDPRAEANEVGYFVIPFEDGPSGAKYEVTVSDTGAVFDPKRVA